MAKTVRHTSKLRLSSKLAPRVGLEPTTLRLHITPDFRQGVDYLFTIPQTGLGGGRSDLKRGTGCTHLVSAPSLPKVGLGSGLPLRASLNSPAFHLKVSLEGCV